MYGTLSEWVHAYDIANAVACTGRLPTNVLLFTSPTNVSDIGLNRGWYPSYYHVWNAVRMGACIWYTNAVACTGRLPTNVLLFTSPTNVSDIGLNGGWYLSHCQVCNAVRMIHIGPLVHTYDLANAVAFIGHLPTKTSDMLPTIHVTYQRVWYRSEWGVISVSLPGMQRCQNDPHRSIGAYIWFG